MPINPLTNCRHSILLIDHEPSVRDVLQVCLSYLGGWEVKAVSTPFQGLKILKCFVPEVILLDAPSLETNARELVAKLRENPIWAVIPIVLITGRAGWFSKAQLQDMGVAGVLPKPFNPRVLPDQIREILHWSKDLSQVV